MVEHAKTETIDLISGEETEQLAEEVIIAFAQRLETILHDALRGLYVRS